MQNRHISILLVNRIISYMNKFPNLLSHDFQRKFIFHCIAIWAAFSLPVQSLKNQYFIVCKYFIWKYTAKKINACFLEGFKEHIGFKSHNFESKFNWTKLILLDLRGTREIQLPLKLSSSL